MSSPKKKSGSGLARLCDYVCPSNANPGSDDRLTPGPTDEVAVVVVLTRLLGRRTTYLFYLTTEPIVFAYSMICRIVRKSNVSDHHNSRNIVYIPPPLAISISACKPQVLALLRVSRESIFGAITQPREKLKAPRRLCTDAVRIEQPVASPPLLDSNARRPHVIDLRCTFNAPAYPASPPPPVPAYILARPVHAPTRRRAPPRFSVYMRLRPPPRRNRSLQLHAPPHPSPSASTPRHASTPSMQAHGSMDGARARTRARGSRTGSFGGVQCSSIIDCPL
ncbi:hypothetical protein B0H11DRAFT_2244402 [Mycena galericulata]|nr:hypothetical protein B0H11DRAFT_2244402 [Mycena galericulata]